MGAHFKALDEGVLLVPLDPRYTQIGFNLISVQVCARGAREYAAAFNSFGCKKIRLPLNKGAILTNTISASCFL